jgi:hypothetical protein
MSTHVTTGNFWADVAAACMVGYNFLSGDLAPITVIGLVLAAAYHAHQLYKSIKDKR